MPSGAELQRVDVYIVHKWAKVEPGEDAMLVLKWVQMEQYRM